MADKWKKHRVGKLYGNSVFIELPPGLKGAEEEAEINRASLFLERAFREREFLNEMRTIITSNPDA